MEVVQQRRLLQCCQHAEATCEQPRATTFNIEGAAFGKSGACIKLLLAGSGRQPFRYGLVQDIPAESHPPPVTQSL